MTKQRQESRAALPPVFDLIKEFSNATLHACSYFSGAVTHRLPAGVAGTNRWDMSVDAIGPDGSVLFHQVIRPKGVTSEYASNDRVWFSTRCRIYYAIEKDGLYMIPVKYRDSVESHLEEIRQRP